MIKAGYSLKNSDSPEPRNL